jgi:hypothetical protein
MYFVNLLFVYKLHTNQVADSTQKHSCDNHIYELWYLVFDTSRGDSGLLTWSGRIALSREASPNILLT